MRRLILGAVFMLLSCAASAQDAPVPPLERLIDSDYSLRLPVHECTVPGTVAGLARRFHFRAGVEYLPVDCQPYHQNAARSKESVNLRGLTIREALGKLSALDPRYRWIESDGVLVIRPVTAWADRTNMLNFVTPSFVLDDVNLGGALDVVVSAITGTARSGGALLSNQTEQASRTFSVNAAATSAGEALDAIVRAHGQAWWEVRHGHVPQNEMGPRITFYTFDESGIGAAIPRQRRQ
jgi:hypothetical protein